MFPGANGLGDSVQSLFSPTKDNSNAMYVQLQQEARSERIQGQGVKDMPSENGNAASQNSPQYGNEKNKQTATTDPMEVEAQWTARLAKFANIAQSTGTKIGNR